MSGGNGIFGSWEKVVARCGRSWPIARQHYRVPTTDASLIVSDVSALNFQNAVVDEGPCGGGRGRVSRRHHLPSGPTNPPPPPPPPQNRGIRNHSCFPVLYLSSLESPWPLAFLGSLGLSRSTLPEFLCIQTGKSLRTLPDKHCPFQLPSSSGIPSFSNSLFFSFSRIQHSAFPQTPTSPPQSRLNPMRVPLAVDARATSPRDHS